MRWLPLPLPLSELEIGDDAVLPTEFPNGSEGKLSDGNGIDIEDRRVRESVPG